MRKAATKTAEAAKVDSQLAASQERLRQQEQALQAARTQAAMLKKTIKRARKRNTELTDLRKSAHQQATRAQQRAEKADAKYERAVLDEILRREKRADLASSNFGSSTGRSLPAGKNRAAALT
jgi:hypothetical protein